MTDAGVHEKEVEDSRQLGICLGQIVILVFLRAFLVSLEEIHLHILETMALHDHPIHVVKSLEMVGNISKIRWELKRHGSDCPDWIDYSYIVLVRTPSGLANSINLCMSRTYT